ncbi:MAG: hypothetical protein WC551_11015 [Patescibacteria group bacterium]
MKESDILHECNGAYVAKTRDTYTVYVPNGPTHCITDSAYADLSLAVARCEWLGNHGKRCALYREAV